MIRRKIFLCVLFVIIIIQAQISVGHPTSRENLQKVLKQALKVNECARIVPVVRPIPLRFRRSTHIKRFQCIITLT